MAVPIAWQSTVAPEMISTSALWLAMIAPTYSASCSSVMSMLSRPPVISMFSILPPATVMETSILSCRPSTDAVYTPSAASAQAGPLFSLLVTALNWLTAPNAVCAAVRPESMASERNTPFW